MQVFLVGLESAKGCKEHGVYRVRKGLQRHEKKTMWEVRILRIIYHVMEQGVSGVDMHLHPMKHE